MAVHAIFLFFCLIFTPLLSIIEICGHVEPNNRSLQKLSESLHKRVFFNYLKKSNLRLLLKISKFLTNVIMDPPPQGSLLFLLFFYMISYTYTDTVQIIEQMVAAVFCPSQDSILWSWWFVGFFLISRTVFFCRFGAIFVSPSPWARHISCKVFFFCWSLHAG